MVCLSRNAIKKAMKNDKFKLKLYRKWDKQTMGGIREQLNVDRYHPPEVKLLFKYLNVYKKSPVSAIKAKHPQNVKRVSFKLENHMRTIEEEGNFVVRVVRAVN